MRAWTTFLLPLCTATLLAAQEPVPVERDLHAGDSLDAALQPEQALARYRAALALDSTNYEALWKASRELVNIAKQIEGNADDLKDRRDSLYVAARDVAAAAVRANPNGAQGHTMIAQALGRLSRTRGGKERVKFARIIYDEAMRAIALDSADDVAWHVVGAWNAEVRRLSGIQRFFAKTLFGAGFMDHANWADAQRYLERAVALRQSHIYHRLELAQVYVDVGKYSAARSQLRIIQDLPIGGLLHPQYKGRCSPRRRGSRRCEPSCGLFTTPLSRTRSNTRTRIRRPSCSPISRTRRTSLSGRRRRRRPSAARSRRWCAGRRPTAIPRHSR
jgi:tetratricopeptide (TPR) repeat protein